MRAAWSPIPCAGRPLILGAFFVLALPAPAFALQAHTYPGLWVHQLAHVFFFLAMLGFAVRLGRSSLLAADPAWRWLAAGAGLFVLWNLWAFTGHVVEGWIPPAAIQADDRGPRLLLLSWREALYAVLKMDHLLEVPAMLCLWVGLRRVVHQHTKREETP